MSPIMKWVQENHPRVDYLVKARPCTERRGGAPIKSIWKRDGTLQDDPAILEKWRCKTPAHWKFTALKRARFSIDGVMCWRHLFYRAIFGDQDEMAATEKLMVRTGYATPCETITQRTPDCPPIWKDSPR